MTIVLQKNLKNNNLKIFTRDSFVIKILYFIIKNKLKKKV